MKILQLIPNLGSGGAERFVVDLSNELSSRNNVSLLTMYNPDNTDLFRMDLSDSITTYSLNKKLGFDRGLIWRLYKTIREIRPDIIHNHLRGINYLMPLIPFLGDIPILHTIHSDAFMECPSPEIRRIRRYFFHKRKIVPITISRGSRDSFLRAYKSVDCELIANGRKYPEKSTLYTSVEKEVVEYQRNKDTRVFVHIGRQGPEKNATMLVKAFNRLVYEGKANAILLLIGGGLDTEESRQIQQQLKSLEKEHSHIHLLSERVNATDYLHIADYFCLSSLYEGMPISLIEAFATGTIPVCTPVGGIPEMIEDLDSSLLPTSTKMEDYYEKLKMVYEMPLDKQRRLKQRAIELFKEKYSMALCADKCQSLYQRQLNERAM